MHKIDEQTKIDLKTIVDQFQSEDTYVRQRQIRTWRKLKLLWENVQNAYYSETAHDWRIPDNEQLSGDSDQGYYDRPVNVYRAYLESIIAALSITVPPITCYPDDADNTMDVSTAKAGDKIATLLFRHNNVSILWLHALFIYCTEGMMAMHQYVKESTEYGTYEEKEYEEVEEEQESMVCPLCNMQMADPAMSNRERDEFDPDNQDVVVDNILDTGMDLCPACMQMVHPELKKSPLIVTRLIGSKTLPKSRVCMDVFGGLNVKIPVWARTQAEIPYLIYAYETHYTNAVEEFGELWDDIAQLKSKFNGTGDTYEQWGRLSPQYHGQYPLDNVTVRKVWLRPSAFNVLGDEEVAVGYKKKYPQGVHVILVNELVVKVCHESLDDHWTIARNPLSDYLHFDPLGMLLTSIQEITNDLLSLTVQTVEHGIPQTFADPAVLDFTAYAQQETVPGAIYPAKPKSGKSLADAFHEVKTTSLSGEVLPFANKVQELGQLVSGALPSLFGGQVSGSRTASEYSMSRAQAQQRLQNVWKMLSLWWKDCFAKAIPMYIKEMKDDEKDVAKDELGNFINVFVRRAELEGKIGKVELEANENLPITWGQQKDAIMALIELNNPEILATLASPENLPYLRRAVGLTDFVIPGEDDRQKQYEEIILLTNSAPVVLPPSPDPMTGMEMPEQELPSVEIDFDVDNHALEADICRRWLVSQAGRLCKQENPEGYKNVLLHMKMHKQAEMQKMMEQMPPTDGPTDGPKEEVPNE